MTLFQQLIENEEVVKLKGLEWHSGGRGFEPPQLHQSIFHPINNLDS